MAADLATALALQVAPGVKFHDGSPFTAVNPTFLEHLDTLWIMSKSWSEKNRVTKPLDFANKEESFTSLNSNGTGPYILMSRAPGIKTVYRRNPNYWGKIEGNVQEIVYTPISNDATRNAALVSGEIEKRFPYDMGAAKKLMAEAGYPDGFEIQLDCPNNRYINDEQICIALAGMWAQLKVKVKVVAQPRATYFPKLEKYDFSMYMLGWGGAVTDAEVVMTPVLRNNLGEEGVGFYNYGHSRNDKFDALAAQSSVEADPKKREELVKAALREYKEQFTTLPLHRQVIPWAARSNVNVVHRADNWLEVAWVTVGK